MLPTKCIATLTRHRDEVWNVKFSPSGNRLASVGKDNTLILWSLTKIGAKYRIKCTHEIKCHSKNVLALNWTNTDDRWVITAGCENNARIWDAKTGRLVALLDKHKDTI